MAAPATFIFRAALRGRASIYREIEIDPAQTLSELAEAIVYSFNFDMDHAFGFYSGLTPAKMYTTFPKFELFADTGDAGPGILGVRKTKVVQAFPKVGHVMLLLFDYGDTTLFKVALRTTGEKSSGVRYPRVVATRGDAPPQYSYEEDDE